MKVRELIEQLQKAPQEAVVILQRDAEGNGYSPVVGVEECWYDPASTCRGEVLSEGEDPEDCPNALLALVIWPKG
jgi:hypothetical protein